MSAADADAEERTDDDTTEDAADAEERVAELESKLAERTEQVQELLDALQLVVDEKKRQERSHNRAWTEMRLEFDRDLDAQDWPPTASHDLSAWRGS